MLTTTRTAVFSLCFILLHFCWDVLIVIGKINSVHLNRKVLCGTTTMPFNFEAEQR